MNVRICQHDSQEQARRRDREGAGWGLPALLLAAGLLVVGCSNPLDVENPNNVAAEDLESAQAVRPVVNGALSSAARAIADIGASYASATDELFWIGSRDAWGALDDGAIGDRTNEFSNAAWTNVGTARFMVDRALRQAQEFSGEVRPELPVRAALYRGILYTYIANIYDNFVIPESPDQAAAPIGPSNMVQLYDEAIQTLDAGIQTAQQNNLASRATQLLAVRAWSKYRRAMWQKLNPPGSVPSDPLVNAQGAVDDALTVLQRVGPTTDWTYEFRYTRGTVTSNMAFQINERQELQFQRDIVNLDPDDPGTVTAVTEATIDRFNQAGDLADLTVVSNRLMNLIVAEAELADGDTQGFATYVNNVRTMDGLTAFDPDDPQVPAMDLLQHELFVNKFMQVKRLSDMYRFGTESKNWLPASQATNEPGTFFPIANIEVQSNPQIGG